MPSYLHEALVEMFRDRPSLAAEVLAGPLGMALPVFDRAAVSPGELTVIVPTEYRADAVITLMDGHVAVAAVVIEAQLRVDARKRRTWPAYVATLYARLGCPVMLLVLCPNAAVASWCAVPIVFGQPNLVLTPLVLGPHQVPVVAEPESARRSPELAVLSAMAHGDQPDQKQVFDALLAAFDVLDHDHVKLYADVVFAVLSPAAQDYLEALMSTTAHRYQSDFARRYFDEGEAKGEARAVLAVLDARGIEVSEDARERIATCTDLAQLDAWVRRAVTATSSQDLFD